MLHIKMCVDIKHKHSSDFVSSLFTMAGEGTATRPRVSEPYSFFEFPLKKLALRKPEFVTKSVFSIPELRGSMRMPFINLTPTPGEWLRVCFDVDTSKQAPTPSMASEAFEIGLALR